MGRWFIFSRFVATRESFLIRVMVVGLGDGGALWWCIGNAGRPSIGMGVGV